MLFSRQPRELRENNKKSSPFLLKKDCKGIIFYELKKFENRIREKGPLQPAHGGKAAIQPAVGPQPAAGYGGVQAAEIGPYR